MSNDTDSPWPFMITRRDPLRFDNGSKVEIGVVIHEFGEWAGAPLPRSYGTKPAVELNGQGMFAEIAIVQLLQAAGWDAAWASTYGGFRYFEEQPFADRSNTTDVPDHIGGIAQRIAAANDGKRAGMFDVVAWRGQRLFFVEAKRAGRDQIRATQLRWLAAALDLGFALDDFMLFEWYFTG